MSAQRWTMRDTVTGTERSATSSWPGDGHGLEFFWTEGNWSCDWNRSLTFYDGEEWDSAGAVESEGRHDCLIGPNGTQRFELLALEWFDGKAWHDVLAREPRRGVRVFPPGPPLYVQSFDKERGIITYGPLGPRGKS